MKNNTIFASWELRKAMEINTGTIIINNRTGNAWKCVLASKKRGFRKKVIDITYYFQSKSGREMRLNQTKLQGLLMAGLYKTK